MKEDRRFETTFSCRNWYLYSIFFESVLKDRPMKKERKRKREKKLYWWNWICLHHRFDGERSKSLDRFKLWLGNKTPSSPFDAKWKLKRYENRSYYITACTQPDSILTNSNWNGKKIDSISSDLCDKTNKFRQRRARSHFMQTCQLNQFRSRKCYDFLFVFVNYKRSKKHFAQHAVI